jgi:hypothetical protein
MGTYCSVFQPKAIWPAVSDSRPKWPRVAASAGPAKSWQERMAGKERGGGWVCIVAWIMKQQKENEKRVIKKFYIIGI